jgi:predicted DNA binding CopG/RHH family protein
MDQNLSALNVKIPFSLKSKIKSEAAIRGINLRIFVIDALEEYLKKCNQ